MIRGRGGYLGPDLTDIGALRTPLQLRESLLQPSARIVDGFDGVTVTLRDGTAIKGVARNNNNYSIQVLDAKGELRLLGAILALVYGGLTFFIVEYVPYFLVFMGMLFFGMLLAAYLARASETYSYAGLQMGLVLPLALVMPLRECANIHAGLQRLEGIVTAVVMSVLVGGIWVSFGRWVAPESSSSVAAQR